jgi:shikimate kinase
MSSGKTHWGKCISRKLNIPFFDLDEQVEAAEGRTISEIFLHHGEEYFRRKEKEVLHIISESHDTFLMACGGGTPCYYNNIDYMNKSGTTVWISSSIDTMHQRLLKDRKKRPLLEGLTDEQVRGYIIKKFSDRKIYYEQATVIIDEENISDENFIQQLFKTEKKQ